MVMDGRQTYSGEHCVVYLLEIYTIMWANFTVRNLKNVLNKKELIK